jgi:HPt (histidine-containing phosphotransfer) domain-containing protein
VQQNERRTDFAESALVSRVRGVGYPTPPVFDAEALRGRAYGDTAVMGAIIDLFLTHAPDLLDAIEASIADSDATALRATAHALKGAAANLGAARVADAASSLERIGLDGRFDAAFAAWQRLVDDANDLFERLRRFRAASLEGPSACAQ